MMGWFKLPKINLPTIRMKLREKEKSGEDVSNLLLEISELRKELNSLTPENR